MYICVKLLPKGLNASEYCTVILIHKNHKPLLILGPALIVTYKKYVLSPGISKFLFSLTCTCLAFSILFIIIWKPTLTCKVFVIPSKSEEDKTHAQYIKWAKVVPRCVIFSNNSNGTIFFFRNLFYNYILMSYQTCYK